MLEWRAKWDLAEDLVKGAIVSIPPAKYEMCSNATKQQAQRYASVIYDLSAMYLVENFLPHIDDIERWLDAMYLID